MLETKSTSVITALSIVLASVILGYAFYAARAPAYDIRVVGSASKRFESDIVKWRMSIGRSAGLRELGPAYSAVAREAETFAAKIRSSGIAEPEINVQPPSAQPVYGQSGITGYNVVQNLFVSSRDLSNVEKLALSPASLFSGEVGLQSSTLEYFSSNLADLKRELLGEATGDARRRAEEIAKTSGLSIKQLASARAGVFQITEPYSTEVSNYGIYNSASRTKDITVTVNAVFIVR